MTILSGQFLGLMAAFAFCASLTGCEACDAAFTNISGEHLHIRFADENNRDRIISVVDLPADGHAFVPMRDCVFVTVTDDGGHVLWSQHNIDVAESSFKEFSERAAEGPPWIEYIVDRDGIFPIPKSLTSIRYIGETVPWRSHITEVKSLDVPVRQCKSSFVGSASAEAKPRPPKDAQISRELDAGRIE